MYFLTQIYVVGITHITKTRLFKYIENVTTKKGYFPYFCSKHRFWILFRTASMSWF